MQIAILPMPHVTGPSIDRRFQLSIDDVFRSVGFINDYSFSPPEVILGSHINKVPHNLHKVFHISQNNEWIFETVFAAENSQVVCLYTKLVRDTVDIAISMNAIKRYRSDPTPIIPLTDITNTHYWRSHPGSEEHVIHSLIPPVFNQSFLDRTTMQLVGVIEEGNVDKIGYRYKPIYLHEPGLLEALISGYFIRPPFYELQINHPNIQITPDKWFAKDKGIHQTRVSAGKMHINDPEFDSIALNLIMMRPSSISLTTRISHALDGLLDLSVTRHMTDPYLGVFPFTENQLHSTKQILSHVLNKSVIQYCRIYGIDFRLFVEKSQDHSSITLEKNIYDELMVQIHDQINDRFVCFYSYLPPLLLATMGVGQYI